LNSEVVIWEKILIVEETHDQKTEKVKPKISGEKNVATNIFRVLIHFVNRLWRFEIGLVAGVPNRH
jgi:hypothetical protein